MTQPGDAAAALTLLERSGLSEKEHPNDIPARAVFEFFLDQPGRRVTNLNCPAMFCISDKNSIAPAKATRAHVCNAAFAEVRNYDTGHFEIYVDDWFDQITADQVRFLRADVPMRRDAYQIEYANLRQPRVGQGEE